MYVYIQLIHFVVHQKVAQHCKAIVLQLKIKKFFLRNIDQRGKKMKLKSLFPPN